jgi:hypothetical protein
MAGVAGRSGHSKFVPTPDQREVVKLLSGRGIPQEHIRRLIRNPQTRKPLAIKTLERAFVTEIQTGKVEVKVKVAPFIHNGHDSRAKTSRRQADKKRTVTGHVGYLLRQDPWLGRKAPPARP